MVWRESQFIWYNYYYKFSFDVVWVLTCRLPSRHQRFPSLTTKFSAIVLNNNNIIRLASGNHRTAVYYIVVTIAWLSVLKHNQVRYWTPSRGFFGLSLSKWSGAVSDKAKRVRTFFEWHVFHRGRVQRHISSGENYKKLFIEYTTIYNLFYFSSVRPIRFARYYRRRVYSFGSTSSVRFVGFVLSAFPTC